MIWENCGEERSRTEQFCLFSFLHVLIANDTNDISYIDLFVYVMRN